MSILAKVQSGKRERPPLALIYGPDGVGKSTLASEAPAPLFLGAESGTDQLNVNRLAMASLADMRAALTELTTTEHPYQTVVLDTADWLEKLVYADVLAKKGKPDWGIEDFGYGKGRVFAFEEWVALLPLFDACRDKGLGIVILAHSMVKKYEDPATPQGYDRYSLKLQDGAKTDVAALLREYVDMVLFTTYEVNTATDDKRRGFGDGSRIIYTERRPAFDAKNRLGLPFAIPFKKGEGWSALSAAMAKAKGAAEIAGVTEIISPDTLAALVAQVKDKALVPKVGAAIKAARTNQQELAKIRNRLLALISGGKEGAPVASASPTAVPAVAQAPAQVSAPATI